MPKKRRGKFVADSDTDFKDSEHSGDESNLEDADEPVTSMKPADPQENPRGVVEASDPHDVKPAKPKPQGMYRYFKSKTFLPVCIRS
jgi:hypothetical protein